MTGNSGTGNLLSSLIDAADVRSLVGSSRLAASALAGNVALLLLASTAPHVGHRSVRGCSIKRSTESLTNPERSAFQDLQRSDEM